MEVYTIGYSSFNISNFIRILFENKIDYIVDVRSSPFSSYYSDYNKESLKVSLKQKDIGYVFLGDNLGARIKAPECYDNYGKAVYEKISVHPIFLEGINRLKIGIEKYRISLLCAEKDPINCHRNILICKNLKSEDINIYHILPFGKIEKNDDTEKRLLKLFGLENDDMFLSYTERLENVYKLQGTKIAFVKNEKYREGVKID